MYIGAMEDDMNPTERQAVTDIWPEGMPWSVQVLAKNLDIHPDGNKRIVLIDRSRERAQEWLRTTRDLSEGWIRYRIYERAVSAEGLQTRVYVVVAAYHAAFLRRG